jgi:hypothetical protein
MRDEFGIRVPIFHLLGYISYPYLQANIMNDLLVALLLGFSFGNLWLCAILVFSLQTTNRFTCLGYLVGRAVTIIILALGLSLIGQYTGVNRVYVNLASGGLLIVFSGFLAATQLLGWTPWWRRKKDASGEIDGGCDGECGDCPAHGNHEYADACHDCHDHGLCSAEEPEVAPLTQNARKVWGKTGEQSKKSGFFIGLLLGMFRGAAMCTKLIVLVPIILSSSPLKSLAIGTVFAISSSIYPILGFILGKFALKLVKYKRSLFIVSCVFLAGSGVFYLWAAFRHM